MIRPLTVRSLEKIHFEAKNTKTPCKKTKKRSNGDKWEIEENTLEI